MKRKLIIALMFLISFAIFSDLAQAQTKKQPSSKVIGEKGTVAIISPEDLKIDNHAPAGAIDHMRITVVSGGDDLRSSSRVSAFVITRDGRRIQSQPLNCLAVQRDPAGGGWNASRCANIANHTRRTFEWRFNSVEYVRPADIHRFGLAFETGRTGPFDTGDNWNLDSLEVEYFVVRGVEAKSAAARSEPVQLVRLSGAPLYRFKSREEWESNPIVPSLGTGIVSPFPRRP